ncbi:MAG TPA: VWA domain-containing protein [Paludibacteraceae bacterium]|jgi:Ca-activated chloride channel family protein|nr:VWA domain-containing protein [Bacteroidales bacterium]HOA46864.1 VWA domain-containing protein [Paludibacteraceae bacterium]HOH71603.1 VWA domain-containing protein [Paludibacteraceae bacterium]HPW95933.1 VWA domain-containing protein [Paludibacteraceae bacterium]HQC05064.1 VWA domain-containing protein [Paludibacteraceae bacterium]
MTFKNPEYLWLLLVLIPMIAWYIFKQYKSQASLQVSTVKPLQKIAKSQKRYLFVVPFILRCAAVALLVIVIARPQRSHSMRDQETEGIDIVLALDISGTMLAEDLRPNRLEAAKNVAIEFISDRSDDNIGLVVFAGESFTQCPLTTDHAVLINLLKSVEFGMIEDGTAIGLGLASAVSRIKDSAAKSKIIILLTDGSNNVGDIAPLTAAEIAQSFGIRVYTIGVGTHGLARYPIQTPMGIRYQDIPVEIDENVLTKIADMTGGSYFRATDNRKLQAIYGEIDQMEKTKLKVKEYTKKSEEYFPFLLTALLCLLAEVVLNNTVLRRLP